MLILDPPELVSLADSTFSMIKYFQSVLLSSSKMLAIHGLWFSMLKNIIEASEGESDIPTKISSYIPLLQNNGLPEISLNIIIQ